MWPGREHERGKDLMASHDAGADLKLGRAIVGARVGPAVQRAARLPAPGGRHCRAAAAPGSSQRSKRPGQWPASTVGSDVSVNVRRARPLSVSVRNACYACMHSFFGPDITP